MNKLSKIYDRIKKLFGCGKKSLSLTTYNVTFDSDWTSDWCNMSPIIENSTVTFNAGRVVSTHGFKISPKLQQQLTYQEWHQPKFKKTIG